MSCVSDKRSYLQLHSFPKCTPHNHPSLLQATAQAADDYSRLLGLSMQFYQAQMSGSLPNWNSISWRKSAHLNDGADAQLDLVGGFYDAGGERLLCG